MTILSDEFYCQHINLDTVNTQVFTNLTSKVGDTNGRGLIVTLTENGLQKDTTGISLNLKWKHRSGVSQGLDNFDVVDLSKGVYKITYPTEMNRSGLVDAFVQIVDSGKVVGTRNMIISVESTVGDDSAIESSNSFSALASALIEVQSWNDRIVSVETQLAETQADFEAAVGAVTVDSEVVLARSGEATLGSRLSKFAEVQSGKNLYNPANNQQGLINTNQIGAIQTVDTANPLVWQKIKISNTNDYTFTGIRKYSITDINNVVLTSSIFVGVEVAVTLLKSNLPATAYYLWVSTYIANTTLDAQVEIGTQKTVYEPYKWFDKLVSDGKELPVLTESEIDDVVVNVEKTWSSKKIRDEYSPELYDNNLKNKQINELTEKLSLANRNIESMYGLKSGKQWTSQTVSVKNPSKQKMLLHLHKRVNDGYDTANDVYLPYAENNFSDVRIKADNGEMLPYHVVYKGNIDIIPDKRLGVNHNGRVFADSNKNMITSKDGNVSRSSDNGVTWEKLLALNISSPIVVNVTSGDVIFFSKAGKLYRSAPPYSSYTEVLDIGIGYTGCYILSTSMVEHPDGDLFLGSYQLERVVRLYKSTDGGLTWILIYNVPDTYQHVHNMFIDLNANPIAIYAGVDGGGGVIKSIDKGLTWVDLKTLNANMPQSTDYGVIYSSPKGFRLLGGETSIVGGYSIIKTTDDLAYKPVLSTGNSVYCVNEIGGKLVASCNSSNSFKNASVYVSDDDGETWVQAYTTQPLKGTGASDGFRFMTKDTYAGTNFEQLIIGCQSTVASPLRVVSDPSTYYAEIMVEIPDDCTELIVESGYLCANETRIYNSMSPTNEKLVHLPLNEGGRYLKDLVTGSVYVGDFSYKEVGKHFSYVYPYVTSPENQMSVALSSIGSGIVIDVPLTDLSAFTISFWGRFEPEVKFNIISREESTGNDFLQFNNHALYTNSQIAVIRHPTVLGVFNKYDIIVDIANGKISTYENARRLALTTSDLSTLLGNISSLTKLKLLEVMQSNSNDAIQHFVIYNGALSETDIYNSFNDSISDNQH